jgi:SAM-dependent methyltransferase
MENLFRKTAWLYDLDYRDIVNDDIPFYIEYAEKQNGSVLELGCGTGRVAIPLAQAGHRVTGLDLSQEMLDVFRGKITADITERITLTHGSMASFSFDEKFSMITAPFRVFQLLTDDVDIKNSLFCIRNHLTDDGIFIVNVFNPLPNLDSSWVQDETVQWERFDEASGNHVVKKDGRDRIDLDNQIIYVHFTYEVTPQNAETAKYREELKLKYYYKDQLKTLIEGSGMEITEAYSWYDKTPLDGREIIYVCRRKN